MTAAVDGPVLAHLAGVHEGWVIGLPIVIFAGFLLAEKRARRKEREQAERDAGSPEA